MGDASQYLRKADELAEVARTFTDPRHRAESLALARQWRELAQGLAGARGPAQADA